MELLLTLIKGYPPRAPGHMVSRWATEAASGASSLYERIEAVLVAQACPSSTSVVTRINLYQAKPSSTGTWEATLPMGTPRPLQEVAHEPVQVTKDPRKRDQASHARRRSTRDDGKGGLIAEKGVIAKNRHSHGKEGKRYR